MFKCKDIAKKNKQELYNKRYVYTFEFEFVPVPMPYYKCVRYTEKTIDDAVFNNCNIILTDESMKSIKFIYTMKEKCNPSELEHNVITFMNEASENCNCAFLHIFDSLKKVTSKYNEPFIVIRL